VEHTGGGDAGVCIRAAVLQTAECAGAAVVLLLLLLQQEALLLLLMGGESQRGCWSEGCVCACSGRMRMRRQGGNAS